MTITSWRSQTIGCTQLKDFIDAATFSTAILVHLRAFFGYGFGRSIGHHATVRADADFSATGCWGFTVPAFSLHTALPSFIFALAPKFS
jgi:hypothetical protein